MASSASDKSPQSKLTPADYAALGLSVPTVDDAPLEPAVPAVPAPAAPAAQGPSGQPVTPAGRHSNRTSQPAADVVDTPTPAARKKKAPAKSASQTSAATPREDAMQASIDSAGNRLTNNDARITTLEGSLNASVTRSKAQLELNAKQHELAMKSIGSAHNDLIDIKRSQTTTRSDVERLVAKMSQAEQALAKLTAQVREGGGTDDNSVIAFLEHEIAELRRDLAAELDGNTVLRARLTEQERRSEELLQTSRLALDTATRTQDTVDRLERAFEQHFATRRDTRAVASTSTARASTSNTQASPPSSSLGRRRLSDSFPELGDARASKRTRLEPPEGRSSYPMFGRAREFAGIGLGYPADDDADAAADAVQPQSGGTSGGTSAPFRPRRSVRIGTSLLRQTIHFGRRNDNGVVLERINKWVGLIDQSGAIPVPTAAAFPLGMADNYRLITFNTHEDMVAFLRAWEHRPQELEHIIATPVDEIAMPPPPSATDLGLHPPKSNDRGFGGDRGDRGFGGQGNNKDARGRRPF